MVPGAKDMHQEEQSREEAKPAELAILECAGLTALWSTV